MALRVARVRSGNVPVALEGALEQGVEQDYITGVWIRDGKLRAASLSCFTYTLDRRTGEILDCVFTRYAPGPALQRTWPRRLGCRRFALWSGPPGLYRQVICHAHFQSCCSCLVLCELSCSTNAPLRRDITVQNHSTNHLDWASVDWGGHRISVGVMSPGSSATQLDAGATGSYGHQCRRH